MQTWGFPNSIGRRIDFPCREFGQEDEQFEQIDRAKMRVFGTGEAGLSEWPEGNVIGIEVVENRRRVEGALHEGLHVPDVEKAGLPNILLPPRSGSRSGLCCAEANELSRDGPRRRLHVGSSFKRMEGERPREPFSDCL